MIIPLLFWLLTLAACAFAATLGGKDGRWAAALILIASALTVPVTLLGHAWRSPEAGVLAVDVLLLAGLYHLTLTSGRNFPIWMTGFHLVAVVTHLSVMMAPEATPKIYRAVAGLWAIPVTISMVLGIILDRRAAARRPGRP